MAFKIEDMVGFDKPLDEINRPRDEGVIVPRIESEKKGKESFARLPEEVKKVLNAAILIYIKSLLDTYQLVSKSEAQKDQQDQISDLLQAFKNLLNLLGSKDQSKHPEVAQRLSELWHKITDDFNVIKFLERSFPEIFLKLKKFIVSLDQYPEGQEHTFGFYLKEHVGQDWLPFPYMEILSNLHKEHQRKPHESHISQWISMLDHIIESLLKP